jgi:hypothetical protein
MAVNWFTKTIRGMTGEKALERWQTKIENAKVTSQSMWPVAKSLLNGVGPRTPTVNHDPSGFKFHPSEEANAITDSF